MLLVFEPFLDMMLMPTAYSDNLIGLNTQFQIQKASMVYKSLNDVVQNILDPKGLRDSVNQETNCPVPAS